MNVNAFHTRAVRERDATQRARARLNQAHGDLLVASLLTYASQVDKMIVILDARILSIEGEIANIERDPGFQRSPAP